MGISDATLQGLFGVVSGSSSGVLAGTTLLTTPSNTQVQSKRRRCSFFINLRLTKPSNTQVNSFHGKTEGNRSQLLKCQCQNTDGIIGISSKDGNGAWLKGQSGAKSQLLHESTARKVLAIEEIKQVRHVNEESIAKDEKSASTGAVNFASPKRKGSSIEDEALHLLQESVVYYCGTPVGTIAAKVLTDGNDLNYDQVFIRDFIPSGIAFLLKGEYDIVRNFILHTLQLQVRCCFICRVYRKKILLLFCRLLCSS